MKQFQDKEEYEFSDIQSLINIEAEESIYLEFKAAGALDKTEGKIKEISKDVASFANSDGGIIIYGINELKHKAESPSFIDGKVFTKEWLGQIINSNIHKRIYGLKIFPIRFNRDLSKTIYIVKVPMSLDAPHMSKDKKFYRRFDFESVPMEEYEVRSLYGRKNKSKLEISMNLIFPIGVDYYDEYYNFKCEVNIINIGFVVEETYKMNVFFSNFSEYIDFFEGGHSTKFNNTVTNNSVKLSTSGTTPIFPEEEVNAIRFYFKVPKQRLEEALKDIKIEFQLLYSNGEHKLNTDLTAQINEVMHSKNV